MPFSGGSLITEKIIGSLVNVSGHTFDMRYDLFFTTERVIVVSIEHPADGSQQDVSLWRTLFLGGFWSSGREGLKRRKTASAKRRRLETMKPDELLDANPRNLEIRYSRIDSAELTRRFWQHKLVFRLSNERTVSFNLAKKQVAEAERLLKLVSTYLNRC
jgi:hypothetical protein